MTQPGASAILHNSLTGTALQLGGSGRQQTHAFVNRRGGWLERIRYVTGHRLDFRRRIPQVCGGGFETDCGELLPESLTHIVRELRNVHAFGDQGREVGQFGNQLVACRRETISIRVVSKVICPLLLKQSR